MTSFYLPSDAAKDRFPDNKAAQYSIPIDDQQQLVGDWEVAVANLTYSNCLYTFNGEWIDISQPCTKVYQCDTGCRIKIPRWKVKKREDVYTFVVKFLNTQLKKILVITRDTVLSFNRKVEKGWIVCLSDDLKQFLGVEDNAMTPYDNFTSGNSTNVHDMEYGAKSLYVDVVPRNEKTLVKKITLKAKHSDMTVDTLVKKFNYLL